MIEGLQDEFLAFIRGFRDYIDRNLVFIDITLEKNPHHTWLQLRECGLKSF
jgi:hypothetical protein